MKLALSLSLSFLLFAFVTKLPLAFTNDVERVLDLRGSPLYPGNKYYIVPAIRAPPRGGGGGLKLGNTGDSNCPFTVLQDYSEAVNGIPVRFNARWSCPCIIYTDTEVEIEFVEKPNCAESSKWLTFIDSITTEHCVGIGGDELSTSSTTFSIQKYEYGYKLAEYRGSSTVPDIYIGRFDNHEGGRRLCWNPNEPFEVVFVDAASYDEGIIRSVA